METDKKDLETSKENRDRKQTEKGRAYKIELLEDQRRSAQRAWRKQLNKIESHLAIPQIRITFKPKEHFSKRKWSYKWGPKISSILPFKQI